MDPRIRERRVAVRRAAGRRRLRMVLVAVGSVLLIAFGYGVTRSPLLDVDTVKVRGAAKTAADDIVGAAGLDERRQMTDLSPGRIARRIEALPWVARATVERRWPGVVEITVTEREPVALVVAPTGEHFAFADATGRILGHAGRPGGDLPLIRGASEVPAPGYDVEGLAPGLAVLGLLDGRPEVAEVHVAGDAVDLVLPSGAVVVLGDATEARPKIVALRTLATRVDLDRIAGIDLRVPTAPALTPR
jgi:cell division protein FtsQ